MLKKCACGGRVGPEGCEEGRGAKAKPRGYTEKRGWPAEQRCIKDTKVNRQPCLCSSPPLALIPYFEKDQHEGKQQSLHYCCYHFQTAIFQAKTNLGTLLYDVYAWTSTGACVCVCYPAAMHTSFHRSPCVYPCRLHSRRVIFFQFYCSQRVQSPLAALPSAVGSALGWTWLCMTTLGAGPIPTLR